MWTWSAQKSQIHVLKPQTCHAPPPQYDVAATWSWKAYEWHHGPCTWLHPHIIWQDSNNYTFLASTYLTTKFLHRMFRCMIPKPLRRQELCSLLTSRGNTKTIKQSSFLVPKFRFTIEHCVMSWCHQQLLFLFLVFLFVSDTNWYSYTWKHCMLYIMQAFLGTFGLCMAQWM